MTAIYGTNNSDVINGTNGDDIIYGQDGDDDLFGRGGDDLIKGGGGADHIEGMSGNDTVDYMASNDRVWVDLTAGTGRHGDAEGDTFYSIENVTGSAYDDYLDGNLKDNVLSGWTGHDHLDGKGGNDVLDGGEGGDDLEGGSGADRLLGGPDYDLARYESSSAGVQVSLYYHYAHGGDAEGDTFDSIENLFGSRHNDLMQGDDGYNNLYGYDGNDVLAGFGGNDLLDGGYGRDVMAGMGGRDIFVWDLTAETATDVAWMDVVSDFDPSQDSIYLHNIDADVYTAGNQDFTFIGNAAFSGAAGEIRYYHDGGNTIIEMQTGNVVDIEGGIVLQGIYTPQASWFVL